jgi:hypothetical protein
MKSFFEILLIPAGFFAHVENSLKGVVESGAKWE